MTRASKPVSEALLNEKVLTLFPLSFTSGVFLLQKPQKIASPAQNSLAQS
jgi:hypothetical protein